MSDMNNSTEIHTIYYPILRNELNKFSIKSILPSSISGYVDLANASLDYINNTVLVKMQSTRLVDSYYNPFHCKTLLCPAVISHVIKPNLCGDEVTLFMGNMLKQSLINYKGLLHLQNQLIVMPKDFNIGYYLADLKYILNNSHLGQSLSDNIQFAITLYLIQKKYSDLSYILDEFLKSLQKINKDYEKHLINTLETINFPQEHTLIS